MLDAPGRPTWARRIAFVARELPSSEVRNEHTADARYDVAASAAETTVGFSKQSASSL